MKEKIKKLKEKELIKEYGKNKNILKKHMNKNRSRKRNRKKWR